MDRLRLLGPAQIVALAVVILIICSVAGYFVVTRLTTVPAPAAAESKIPANLDSEANQKVLQALDTFEAPRSLPAPDPLRTPDPNSPSTVNPFSR